MGITKECFGHYETLVRNKIINFNQCNVVEIGSQTVHMNDKDFLRSWAHRIKISDSFVDLMYPDITGEKMHGFFGHKYASVDLDTYDGQVNSLQLDLNTEKCPKDLLSSANLVTNYGTTEHIMNQTNVFEFIHDLTAPWGAMVHVLPMALFNHGFINYNPVFFTSLAYANQYKILTLATSKTLQYNNFQDVVPYAGDHITAHTFIHVILIKTSNEAFKIPSQIFLNGIPQ